jgi:hypothetical protein
MSSQSGAKFFVHNPYGATTYDMVPVDCDEVQVDQHSAAGETDSVTDTSSQGTPIQLTPKLSPVPEHSQLGTRSPMPPRCCLISPAQAHPQQTQPQPKPQHEYLTGQCEFLDFNSGCRIDQYPATGRQFKLFVGHLTFEITAPQLRWIIHMLTGVTSGKIETRGLGCYMVFLQNEEELWTVKGLHKRALFDNGRVWFARNALQEGILSHYAASYLVGHSHSRLPSGLMVVDEETTRKRNRKISRPSQPSTPEWAYHQGAMMQMSGYLLPHPRW